MTDSAYKGLTEIEQIFKSLVWDNAIKAGQVALVGAVPFFGLPVINTITNWFIGIVTNWIYKIIVLFIDIEAIKLVNAVHQAQYDAASVRLKIIAIDRGINSDEFKKARDEAKAALSKLTNINPN